MHDEVDSQLELILRGCVGIIDESELRQKIVASIREHDPLTVKLGVDPTAPDLHLGHTVVLRKLRHFQDLGHKASFLIGDFTARIGDPTGRDQTRPPLTDESVQQNALSYRQQISKILNPEKLNLVFNSSWLRGMTLEDVIRLTSMATMARILEHNTFRARFDQAESIRFNEMLYPFLQAYDSVILKADVELGGTDQTFNLTFGRDVQRTFGQEPQVCLTMPILPGTDGRQKMSKSLGNYIGITEPPYVIFEKIMRMVDDNIALYFMLLTDHPVEEIRTLEKALRNNPTTEYIVRQKAELAYLVVRSYHGEEAARLARDSYGKDAKEGIPTIKVPRAEVEKDHTLSILRLLMISGRAGSKTEARRLIGQGGVYVDNIRVDSADQQITIKQQVLLRVGKSFIGILVVQ